MTFNELMVKIGVDKILHFCLGGFITALFTIPMILQEAEITETAIAFPIVGTMFVAGASFIKEILVDGEFNKKDILWSVLGCIPVFIVCALGILFHNLSL